MATDTAQDSQNNTLQLVAFIPTQSNEKTNQESQTNDSKGSST
jgi:hypothetical protein